MSENNKYERFGKYLVLDHLVDGGMAKISRARFLGEQADRLVAIKMVQPQFSKDADFVRMFEDELKVCFALEHPNIAQTYDYGKWNDQLYTAMELIEGRNLKEYLDRLSEKKLVFPVEISTYITSQICQGLHYAHMFVDKLTGKPLNIVHRDISPHNVMLSFDGSVKVIDFGIAKAESNSEKTQAGTIKGKLAYLAPEYLEGLTLDHRYDQFAVGITLWELLCNRRLFTAKNDLAVLKLIQACKVPAPSSINPNVPKELDEIVLKALSKDRTQRYEDMDKLNRALVKFLYSTYPEFNATDLQYFANELFKSEIDENRKKYVEYGKIDITPFIKDLNDEKEGRKAAPAAANTASAADEPKIVEKATEFEFNDEELSGLSVDGIAAEDTSDKTKPSVQRTRAKTNTQRRVVRSQNATRVTKTGSLRNPNVRTSGTRTNIKRTQLTKKKSSGGNSTKIIGIVAASIAGLIFFKPALVQDLTGIDLSFIGGSGRTISSTQAGSSAPKEATVKEVQGKMFLSGADPYMEIYINGVKHPFSGSEYHVPIEQKVSIKIEKKGYLPFKKEIFISGSRPVIEVEVPELDVARIGLFSTSMNYNGYTLKMFVNGSELKKSLPVRDMRVPAGEYEAVLTNELLGTEKKVNFKIEENKKFFLD